MGENEKPEGGQPVLSEETINAFVETLNEIVNVSTQALSVVAEAFSKIGRKLSENIKRNGAALVDALLYANNDNPKWWHLYKHAKKARTRKKYRNKLLKQYLRKVEIAKTVRDSLND